jgi:hypothetical protein
VLTATGQAGWPGTWRRAGRAHASLAAGAAHRRGPARRRARPVERPRRPHRALARAAAGRRDAAVHRRAPLAHAAAGAGRAAARMRYASWLVANLHVASRSTTRPARRRRGTTWSTGARTSATSTRCTRACGRCRARRC